MRSKGYKHGLGLSKNFLSLKDSNTEFCLKWRIKTKPIPYKCGSRKCDLCLPEKVAITRLEKVDFLKKRTEWWSKCRHRGKSITANIKWTIKFCRDWVNNCFIVQISFELCYCSSISWMLYSCKSVFELILKQ